MSQLSWLGALLSGRQDVPSPINPLSCYLSFFWQRVWIKIPSVSYRNSLHTSYALNWFTKFKVKQNQVALCHYFLDNTYMTRFYLRFPPSNKPWNSLFTTSKFSYGTPLSLIDDLDRVARNMLTCSIQFGAYPPQLEICVQLYSSHSFISPFLSCLRTDKPSYNDGWEVGICIPVREYNSWR